MFSWREELVRIFRSKKLFFEIWISLIITILITITLLSGILYFNFERIVVKTIKQSNSEILEQISYVAQHLQEIINFSGVHTFHTPAVKKLIYKSDLNNFAIIQGIRQLEILKNTNNHIHSVYAYNGQRNYFYATSNYLSAPADAFFDQEIIEIIKKHSLSQGLEPIPRILKNGDDEQHLFSFVLHGFPTQNHGALVINVYAEWVQEMIESLGDNQAVFVVDNSGIVMSHPNPSFFLNNFSTVSYVSSVISDKNSRGYFIDEVNGIKSVVTYVPSDFFGWYFIRVVPYHLVIYDILLMKKWTIYIFLIILAVGIGVAFFHARGVYTPVENLVTKVSHTEVPKNSDEIKYLSDVFTTMEDKASELDELKDANKKALKHEIMISLLKGHFHQEKALRKNFEEFSISLSINANFQLALVKGLSLEQCNKVLQFFNSNSIYEIVEMDESISLLILQDFSQKEKDMLIYSLLKLNPDIIVLSSKVDKINNIATAYCEVSDIIKYQMFYPDCQVLDYRVIRDRKDDFIYPEELERDLLSALKSGSKQEAETIYEDIISYILEYKFDNIKFSIKKLFLSIQLLLKQLEAIGYSSNFEPAGAEVIESKFATSVNFDEINQIFYRLFEKIYKISNESSYRKNVFIIEKITEKIEKEYYNHNLSLQLLADDVKMSAPYVGRLFKSIKGLSVNQFINSVRINEAKKLLKQTSSPVKDIIGKVGFINESYFYTLFKKNEGMTPNQFRNKKN